MSTGADPIQLLHAGFQKGRIELIRPLEEEPYLHFKD